MEQREFWLRMPNATPFDQDNWFETFLGSFVLPVVETGALNRFWFSRYGGPGNHQARFRYEVDGYERITEKVDELFRAHSLEVLSGGPFDILGDLSGVRFLGRNQRQTDGRARGSLIFDYLHATARLFLDCLSHRDEEGRWHLEVNEEQLNNPFGSSFETYHHLLCNMTDVPTAIALGEIEGQSGQIVRSPLYFTLLGQELLEKGMQLKHTGTIRVWF